MRPMAGAALASAFALAFFGPAFGQPPPALEDPEANVVEELVVQAREPGPAWWRVEDADSTVYILGVGEDLLPPGVTWDRRYLDRRLRGANSLIVGTRIRLGGGVRDIPLLLRARSQMKSRTPLEETLSEPLRARFVAARERIGQPASRYSGWMGLMAGMRLAEDSRARMGGTSVVGAITAQAKRAKVRVVHPASYDIAPSLRQALASLTPALHEQCLEGALRDVEAPPARTEAAARGWAGGDVAAALTEPRSFEKCMLLLAGGGELWRRAARDQAAAIAKALETPGHSVALVSLRPLLARDGVIEQLKGRGLSVVGPNAL